MKVYHTGACGAEDNGLDSSQAKMCSKCGEIEERMMIGDEAPEEFLEHEDQD